MEKILRQVVIWNKKSVKFELSSGKIIVSIRYLSIVDK